MPTGEQGTEMSSQPVRRGRGRGVWSTVTAVGKLAGAEATLKPRGRGRGIIRSSTLQVSAPKNEEKSLPCTCDKRCAIIHCDRCGYFDLNIKKFQICPRHPEIEQGMKACPDCGAPGDQLEEHY